MAQLIASDTKDPWFESSRQLILITINCNEETKIHKKRPGMAKFV